MIQHITYNEWLPIILGPRVLEIFELKLLPRGYYRGYNESVNPTISNAFAASAFRYKSYLSLFIGQTIKLSTIVIRLEIFLEYFRNEYISTNVKFKMSNVNIIITIQDNIFEIRNYTINVGQVWSFFSEKKYR